MELIYLWVSDYRNIENTGFKLSSNFDVKFNNNNKGYRELVIRNLTINNLLFEEKIENVHAIIGKNGAGKTNLMDLLGFNYKERKMAFNAKYFILYHMSDDIYAIEGRGFELIEPNIVNNPTVGSSLNSLNYVTEPYSLLIRKLPKKNKFEFISFLQFKEQYHRNDHIYYIKDFDHNSNFGINYSKNSVERNADSALFNRAKIDHNDINKLSMYKLITYFNNSTFKKNSKHLFNLNESVYVRVNYSIDYNDEYIDIDLKIENEKFTKILDRVSRIYTKEELKHQFILNFMEQYIYYSYASLKQFEKEKTIISNSNYKKLINESDLINITEVEYYLKVQKIISDEIKKYTDVTNHDKFFESFSLACSYLLNLNAEFFDDKTQINIPINILEDKQVIDFLNFIDECQSPEVNYLNNALVISIGPMSDGEQAFIKLFSALFYGLTLNRYEEKRTAIILLDEPDKSMHPEWSRILLSEVMNFLKRLEEGYERYQIIITSHSPFVISDLPKENVIALDKHLTTGKCVIKKIEIEQTFANNIHSILIDKFFMTATIGEFALDKVNSVINRLVQKESLSEEETVESKYIISLVGDELIREKLVELFNDKIKFQREGNSR